MSAVDSAVHVSGGHVASPGFDAAVLELLLAAGAGAALLVAGPTAVRPGGSMGFVNRAVSSRSLSESIGPGRTRAPRDRA